MFSLFGSSSVAVLRDSVATATVAAPNSSDSSDNRMFIVNQTKSATVMRQELLDGKAGDKGVAAPEIGEARTTRSIRRSRCAGIWCCSALRVGS